MPGSVRSASVSWLWPKAPRQVACELVSRKVHTLYLYSGIISPLRLHEVKGVCVFRYNLPPAFLAEWLGSFMCHCGNMGVEQTRNESAHKVNSGEENSSAAPAGIWTCNLSVMSPAFLPTSNPSPHLSCASKYLSQGLMCMLRQSVCVWGGDWAGEGGYQVHETYYYRSYSNLYQIISSV